MSERNERDLKEVRKERQRQREQQMHQQQVQFDGDKLDRDYLESILDTDVLQEQTITKIRSYIDRNWILSNRTEARNHDAFHKLDVMELKIKGLHPPSESAIQGPMRAFLFDNPSENLTALTSAERAELESFFDTLRYAVLPRGKDGFERRQLVTEVRESRTESESIGDDDGGRLGLFRR